jgi:organic hydroperoxide reductase OsmC/OhrA
MPAPDMTSRLANVCPGSHLVHDCRTRSSLAGPDHPQAACPVFNGRTACILNPARTDLEIQILPVEFGRSGDRDWFPETLLCMAAAPCVLDQFFHLLRRRGTLQVDGETDAVEGGAGAVQAELVRDIEAATNLNLAIFHRNIVKMREPRNLGEQSKSGAHEEK